MYYVYYSDGSVIDSNNNPSPRDVQAILCQNTEGDWIIRSGGDFYVFWNGEWTEVDLFGLFDFLLDSGIVLFGRTVPNDFYSSVIATAMADREALFG